MVSVEGDNFVVFHSLNAFEIWPDKRGGFRKGVSSLEGGQSCSI